VRVALIKPPIGGILGLEMLTLVEPLGLECVAGALEVEGHECRISDLRLEDFETGLAATRDFGPDLVGIQCNFTTERNRAVRVAKRVRELLPDAVVMIGGHDASRDPAWFAQSVFDIVAIGDGEEVVPLLVEALAEKKSLDGVPGIAINGPNGQRKTEGCVPRRELDELPLPARHLIARHADEYYINFRRPLALLETARGCPYRCNFCSVWKFHEKTFREKSPDRVVQELATIAAPNVFITDDIFWLNPRRGMELANALKASGIRKFFTVQTRTDLIVRHPELIEAWKDCGNLAIFLGVEKVDDEGLKAVNKKNLADNNVQAIRLLKEMGVGFTSNFIVDPAWDRDDFKRLRDWISEHGAYNSGFSVLTPLPGTDLWDSAVDQVTTRDWERFDIVHAVLPTRLPLPEFYQEYARLWAHSLEVRGAHRGRFATMFGLIAALATGRVRWSAVRKGMMLARVFSDASTFLKAHEGDEGSVRKGRAA